MVSLVLDVMIILMLIIVVVVAVVAVVLLLLWLPKVLDELCSCDLLGELNMRGC